MAQGATTLEEERAPGWFMNFLKALGTSPEAQKGLSLEQKKIAAYDKVVKAHKIDFDPDRDGVDLDNFEYTRPELETAPPDKEPEQPPKATPAPTNLAQQIVQQLQAAGEQPLSAEDVGNMSHAEIEARWEREIEPALRQGLN